MGDFAEREAKRARKAAEEAEMLRKREAAKAFLATTGAGPLAEPSTVQALIAARGDNTFEVLKEKAAAVRFFLAARVGAT